MLILKKMTDKPLDRLDSRNISPSNNDSGMRKSCRTILLPKISNIAAKIEDGFPEALA